MTDEELSGGLSDTGRALVNARLEGKEDPHPTPEELAAAMTEEGHLEDLASLHYHNVDRIQDEDIIGQPDEEKPE